MRSPQLAQLFLAPTKAFERSMAHEPRWSDVLAALSVPTAIAGAAIAFAYASSLLAAHYVANVMFVGASFTIQSFAAAVTGHALYRRPPRATLLPFAKTLVPHEVMFVGLTGMLLVGGGARGAGAVLVLACLLWQLALTYLFFRALGGPRTRVRAALATSMHYAVIALLVGAYAHAQDLLPYPAGLP